MGGPVLGAIADFEKGLPLTTNKGQKIDAVLSDKRLVLYVKFCYN